MTIKLPQIKIIFSVCSDVYSRYTLQIILTSDIFIVIHSIFHYSTVKFNRKLYSLNVWNDQTHFDYNFVLFLIVITLKMAT
jgi:hypothetical protein